MITLLPHQKGRDQWGAKSAIHEDRQQSAKSCMRHQFLAQLRVILMHPGTSSVLPRAIYNSQELPGPNLRHIPQIHRERSRKQKTPQTF